MSSNLAIPIIPSSKGPELWGGVECTINRVGDAYIEQLERTGHVFRLSDLDLFRQLGIKALRQPVLWERVAPTETGEKQWTSSDAALTRLRELHIRPIVGLVHHGSGPLHTNLLDEEFPGKLADYAFSVAERYPWVSDYTPVNEPLTTARFSGLYGHWYPHGKDDCTFARVFLTQCRAIVLAMRSIRKINPEARLIQTEDLGTIFSTPPLEYQARFENERRWCTYDLLSGRIDSCHPMWDYFSWAGVPEAQLEWFRDNTCPPSVIGVNHYLSSDRFLDERIHLYPQHTHGGNGRDHYADVLARRVRESRSDTLSDLLLEAANRYHLPVAITECHNGCTREEQLRWFQDVWKTAKRVREHGTDLIAVTAWSLLGAFDWDRLVTVPAGQYESGVFDIRSIPPRPTAVANLIGALGDGREFSHPVFQLPGWWTRADRFAYGISVDDAGVTTPVQARLADPRFRKHIRPILITGSGGTLAHAFHVLCEKRGIAVCSHSRGELDIADPVEVRRALLEHLPWAVVNCAEYSRVNDAENNFEGCYRENTEGPAVLANECAKRNIRLLTFSSDLVFDGNTTDSYVESAHVSPLNCYGMSKALAEKIVLEALPSTLVVRCGPLFGTWDEDNFLLVALRNLAVGRECRTAADMFFSPTYIPDLANVCLDLLIDSESGIWHLANPGGMSPAVLLERTAKLCGISARSLRRCNQAELDLPAKMPLCSVLHSERGVLLPPFDNALERYVSEVRHKFDAYALAA